MTEENLKCPYCEKEFIRYSLLRSHARRIHNILNEELYITVYLNGVWPTCGCGCGEKLRWGNKQGGVGFGKYIEGHGVRVNNPYQLPHVVEKSKATRKKMWENGELHIWCEGLSIETNESLQKMAQKTKENKGRALKISKALKGVAKSKEHAAKSSAFIKEYWKNPINREEQSHKRLLWMKKNDYTVKSKLEEDFVKILESLNIEFERQYYVREIKGYYDFYLPKQNILIEVQGDFWHCNPQSKYFKPIYDCQKKNLIVDLKKKLWCEENKIPLIEIWEMDMKIKTQEIIEKIRQLL